MDRYEDFKARIAAGMRPGKAARSAFGRHLDDRTTQDLAELAGLEFTISADETDFVEAYSDVRSCMQGKGEMCYAFYSQMGVEIAMLRTSSGTVVARALVVGEKFNQAYGDKHYVLEALLREIGFEQSEDWLEGRSFAVKTRRIFRPQQEIGGWIFQSVQPRDVRYFLRRGWSLPSGWLADGTRMERAREVCMAHSAAQFARLVAEGWLPAFDVRMVNKTRRRMIGVVVDAPIMSENMPYVDGYRHRMDVLARVENDNDAAEWHQYEWAEQYAA